MTKTIPTPSTKELRGIFYEQGLFEIEFFIFRKNSDSPREAIVTNYNRVLILPRVRVEDQGEYVCRAYNDKVSITGSVTLSIQAR